MSEQRRPGRGTGDQAMTQQSLPVEPTWEDVWAAIGREVWKLAPQDYQDSGHRDLTFLTCWQNVMEAVDKGIASCYPDDIEATGRCCCAGCVGMGPCDREAGA